MKKEKEIIIIAGFMGFAIGVCSMMFINTDKEQKIVEKTNNCHEIIEEIEYISEEVKEIEFSVCEECWYNVFDCGNEYQFTN